VDTRARSEDGIRFGSFELDERTRELRSGASRIRLQDQPYEILRLLLRRPGDVVTREELRRQLWPDGTFVDFEHSLNAAVKRLRAALGDDADNPRFVETLPRRGYRFVASAATSGVEPAVPQPRTPRVRLAVLPFSNLGDERHEYFGDGLHEELISQLGGLCRGRIGVLARWSSLVFKGTSLRACEVGEALRADYLLEGSVRHEDDRVRVTARLIEAAGETQIWAEMYDRHLTHCLTVQADVAAQIARALAAELVPDERTRTQSAAASAAYQAYLKGRYFWNKVEDQALDQAIAYYEEALTLDASFGPAAAALARARVARAEDYRDVPRLALASAREAAQRALDIDGTLYEAHLALAEIQRMLDFDWAAAEASYVKALSLNPSSESAHRGYAMLLSALGRHREAVRESDRAIELDPLCLVVGGSAAWVAYAAGDYDAAIEIARNTIDMDPEFVRARRVLAAAYLQSGRHADAVQELEASAALTDHPVLLAWLAHAKAITGHTCDAEAVVARMLSQPGYRQHYALAVAYVGLGRVEEAFEELDTARLDRDPMLAHVAVEPRFAPLRQDPRFGELLTRLGLPTSPAPSAAGPALPRR